MGRKIVIDSDKISELLTMMELGEWASALDLVRKLADFELRDSIRAAQRRNYELYMHGKYTQEEYEENRRLLRQLSR